MTDNAQQLSGSLRIDVDADSFFLRSNLPFVVRDAHGAFVADGSGPTTLSLPGGLYSLTSVGPDGRPSVNLAEVRPGERTPVLLGERGRAGGRAPEAVQQVGAERGPADAVGAEAVGAGDGLGSGDAAVWPDLLVDEPPAVTSAAFVGCHVRAADADGWDVVPDQSPAQVPRAQITVAGRAWEICLPVNPREEYPLSACRVYLVGDPERPRTAFAPERRVARFVAGINGRGNVLATAGILSEATGLLMSKYSDPPAAALAALTLHRIGQLNQRPSWIENLAEGFPWMPDGGILLAALLAHDPDPAQRRRGLKVLLAATASRPLYTDGLSLALELLRRWPDDASKSERAARLAGLADYSAYADWDSLTLCVETSRSGS